MNQQEIERYLALPERFRLDTYGNPLGLHDIDCTVGPLAAIASMLVGLRVGTYMPRLVNIANGTIGCEWVDNTGDDWLAEGSTDFLALLAACEAIVKEDAQ